MVQGSFSFAKVLASADKKKRKPPPNTPAHNYADVAEAVLARAKIIEPVAFKYTDDEIRKLSPELRQRLAGLRATAMQKARNCREAYDHHLGNQRLVTLIVRNGKQTSYYKIKRGQGPKK